MKEKLLILKNVLIKYSEQIDIIINDYESDEDKLQDYMSSIPYYIKEAVEELQIQ